MKYSVRQYAEALYGALEGKAGDEREQVLRNFLNLVRRNHIEHSLNGIIREYEKHAIASRGMVKVHIETPESASDALKREIETAVGKPVEFSEKVNPHLLAGIRILVNDTILIDATALRRLEKLYAHTHYGSITNN